MYERALQVNPNLWAAANNLAFLISENESDPEALSYAARLAAKALKQQPDNPVVLDTVGWVDYRRGNLPQALRYMQEAVAKNEDSPILNYHLATVLYATGRSGEARIQLEKALVDTEDFYGRSDAEVLLEKLRSPG